MTMTTMIENSDYIKLIILKHGDNFINEISLSC